MREMYNSTFVYLKNFVLLYFLIPDSGFRLLGLPLLTTIQLAITGAQFENKIEFLKKIACSLS